MVEREVLEFRPIEKKESKEAVNNRKCSSSTFYEE